MGHPKFQNHVNVAVIGLHLLTSLVTCIAMVSFVPLVARLPGAWFRPCFGWLVPGGGWFCLFFPLLLVWGGCGWLSSGLRFPCCGLLRGQFTAPQRSCAVYFGQFMDKVMIVQHQVAGIFCRQEIKFAPKIEETPSGHARARDNSQAHSWLQTRPAREKPSKTVSKIVLIGDLQTSQQSYSRN